MFASNSCENTSAFLTWLPNGCVVNKEQVKLGDNKSKYCETSSAKWSIWKVPGAATAGATLHFLLSPLFTAKFWVITKAQRSALVQ